MLGRSHRPHDTVGSLDSGVLFVLVLVLPKGTFSLINKNININNNNNNQLTKGCVECVCVLACVRN